MKGTQPRFYIFEHFSKEKGHAVFLFPRTSRRLLIEFKQISQVLSLHGMSNTLMSSTPTSE